LNPITETRYTLVRYVVLWGLFATAFAVVFNTLAGLPLELAAMDGAVFGVMAGFEGTILWNVLKYGTDGIATPLLRAVYRTVVGILFIVVAVGAVCLAMWVALGTLPPGFVATIPARCLTVAAVYAFFALWFWFAARSEWEHPRQFSAGPDISRADISRAENGAEGGAEDGTPAGTPSSTSAGHAPPPAEPLERITVRGAGGKIEVIALDRIVYLRAEGDYVAIVTDSGRWLKEGTMKWFEGALPRRLFVRVHRSYIVSVSHISRIETSGRDHILVLRSGSGNGGGNSGGGNTSLRISDSGFRLLKQILSL
jgi:hypothetical protein